ncbi:hypothetical protein V2I01_05770 [Micromonospora sp. BRA006-A]|nr:hypothetical protein [Micromonospora sp. BRA006-A]
MDLVGCVERVLDLRTLDLATHLPGPDTAASRLVGHGYLVLYLSASEEFEDNGHVVEVLERFEQDCAGLEAAVSELWGPAVGVDLRPFMDSMVRGESVPKLPGSSPESCRRCPPGTLETGASVSASACATPTVRWF